MLRTQHNLFDGAMLIAVASCAVGTLLHANYDSKIRDAESSIDAAATVCRSSPSFAAVDVSQSIVDELNRRGLVVLRDVLDDGELNGARNDAYSIFKEGRMTPSSADYESIRQDVICFIRQTDGTPQAHCLEARQHARLGPSIMGCVSLLRSLTSSLEEHGYKRSFNHMVPTQCQLAYYPGNHRAVYVPHRDAASDSNFWQVGLLGWLRAADYRRRTITAILYLNVKEWNCDPQVDGGALICHIDAKNDDVVGGNSSKALYINPVGGTLVIFDSRHLLHEVAPSNRGRFALTIWITGDNLPEKIHP